MRVQYAGTRGRAMEVGGQDPNRSQQPKTRNTRKYLLTGVSCAGSWTSPDDHRRLRRDATSVQPRGVQTLASV